MAKIVEYNAPIEGLKVTERGSAAYETLARTQDRAATAAGHAIKEAWGEIGSGISTVGKAYKDVEARKEEADSLNEISQFANTANEMSVRHTQSYFTWLNDEKQDHSPEAYAEFSKSQHDEWQGAIDGLKTKQAKSHAIGLAGHQTMSQAQNYNTDMISINVNSALRAEDEGFKKSELMLEKPSQGGAGGTPGTFAMEMAERQAEHDARMGTLSSMKPEARNAWDKEFRARQERMAIVGARKFMQQYKPDAKDPEKALAEAKDYILSSASPYAKYLNEQGRLHMDTEFREELSNRKRMSDSAYQAEVRDADTKWKSHMNELIASSWQRQADGTFRQTVTKELLEKHSQWMEKNAPDKIGADGMPGALKHAPIEQVQKAFNDFVEIANNQNEHIQDNGQAISQLVQGMTNGQTKIEDIINARHSNLISDKTYARMTQEFNELKGTMGTPEFKTMEEAIRNQIVSRVFQGVPVNDIKGWGMYAAAMEKFVPLYRQAITDKTWKAGDGDANDPNSMLGKFLREGGYVRDFNTRTNDILGQVSAPGALPTKELNAPKPAKGAFNAPAAPAAPTAPRVLPNAPMGTQPARDATPRDSTRLGALGSPQWPHGLTGAAPGVALALTDQAQRVANVDGYGEQLTGTVTINGNTYRFINGGGGRGSIPFGDYSVSNFRNAEARASMGMKNLGDTFDLNNVHDPLIDRQRSALRIHMALSGGTAGCIGIVGGPEAFKQFAEDMKAAKITTLRFGPVSSAK
jgi:hypothetical protein